MGAFTYAAHVAKRDIGLPLRDLKAWSDKTPFKIDALGLVTLLGADEVSTAIGSLQPRRYTGALPLLAAFVLAGDRFTSPQPGFTLYDISDGIQTSNLAGWFTRWLASQSINSATTVFEWKLRESRPEQLRTRMIAPVVSAFLVMPLLIGTILMGDWYGVTNSGAIVISIVARLYILKQWRESRDNDMTPNGNNSGHLNKLLILQANGTMVTVRAPWSVMKGFTRNGSVNVERPGVYRLAKQAAWLALAIHMLSLGMCTLVTQIYTVVLLVGSTVAMSTSSKWASDTQRKTELLKRRPSDAKQIIIPFNEDWYVVQYNPPKVRYNTVTNEFLKMDRRQIAWARLQFDGREEDLMLQWRLLPGRENKAWWVTYCDAKDGLRDPVPIPSSRSMNSDAVGCPDTKTPALAV